MCDIINATASGDEVNVIGLTEFQLKLFRRTEPESEVIFWKTKWKLESLYQIPYFGLVQIINIGRWKKYGSVLSQAKPILPFLLDVIISTTEMT